MDLKPQSLNIKKSQKPQSISEANTMSRHSSYDSFDSMSVNNEDEKKPSFLSSLMKKPKEVSSIFRSITGTAPVIEEEEQELTIEEENDAFLLARLEKKQSVILDTSTSWFKDIQNSFQTAKNMFTTQPDSDQIDWDFWGKVINDYENMIRLHPRQFTKNLHKGLPEPIRGMMWQLMANSKSESLEEEYLALLLRSSRHEKLIQRDLARTFPGHEFFKDPQGPGQTSLFNILKGFDD